ncbi:MAG: AMP-dependent synthetase/ligase [Myxococcota bacterium]
MPVDTIPTRLFEQAEKNPHRPAYFVRSEGIWRGTTWERYAEEVKQAGKALLSLGFEPGQSVAILGFNRPEWVIFDVACMAVGGAPAGIYTTCSPEEVRYIVDHCEAPVVLVENEEQWRKIDTERAHMPKLRHVVMMKGAPRIDDEIVLSWDEFLARGDGVSDESFFGRMHALEPDGLATLIYTSGTTGPPKGVMLSHRNLTWTADTARQITEVRPEDVSLSYLPLSHIAEQMFTIHGPLTNGTAVYFAESIEKVPDNLKEVQPQVFFGVPRIWEKFHSGISAKLQQATGVKKALVDWARGVATRATAVRARGGKPSGMLAVQYELAGRLVFSKLKEAIGLARARVCVSGAAPIAPEVLEFFASLDVVVLEVYGQSEDCGPTSFNLPNRFEFGTVGPPIPGVEVRIADDGEILVKGPNVFLGYYKDEAATNDTLIDGWLHSGDLGEIDEEGFLSITGRKKDIIITAGGKNIAPKNIEHALKNHELINEAVVIGDRRRFLSVLVTLDPEAADAWAKKHGVSPDDLPRDPKLQAEIQRAIDEVNAHLARVEQVKKFTILERNLTIEDGELTPTLKVKRNVVSQHFEPEIEAMYAE